MPVDVTVPSSIDVDGSIIETVLAPESVGELAALLSEASAGRKSVLILGGGTRLRFGNVGGPFDLAITTRRLNRILHYEPDDMTMAVESGCTIAGIAQVLQHQGQYIALDAAWPNESTIGGAYASGLSGPRRLSGGSLKDWTIGVESVGPDGTPARAGGMVVKNVTGYDMMHVHHAALGAFGVVTRLNLKVFPVSGPPRSVVATFPAMDGAFVAAYEMLRSQLQPSSVLIDWNARDGWMLRVRCDGPVSVVEDVAQRMRATIVGLGQVEHCEIGEDPTDAMATFAAAIDLRGNAGVARLAAPASKQPEIIRSLREIELAAICADVGSGLIYLTGSGEPGWVDQIRRAVHRPTFLALPVESKHGVDVFGEIDPANATVVQRLKAVYDPDGVLNAGRFVLGL